jgi:hypothetical protein
MFKLLKQIALYLLVLLGIIYGYQYMTGKSIATLPQEISKKFQGKGPDESTNPKYHKNLDSKLLNN